MKQLQKAQQSKVTINGETEQFTYFNVEYEDRGVKKIHSVNYYKHGRFWDRLNNFFDDPAKHGIRGCDCFFAVNMKYKFCYHKLAVLIFLMKNNLIPKQLIDKIREDMEQTGINF